MKNYTSNAQKLIRDIYTKRHPEYGMTKLKGISLSSSDIDILELIAQSILQTNVYPSHFMPSYGEQKAVLEAYKLPTAPAIHNLF